MHELEVVERAEAEWASHNVIGPKMDSTLGLCADLRRLNTVVMRDSFPIRGMDRCIDSLGDTTILSTLNVNSGFG